MSNQSAAESAFDALGDPQRRQIIQQLRHGPLPVGKLAEQLTIGRSAVSKHLRVLRGAGLVSQQSIGTRNLYGLAPEALLPLQQWLTQNWTEALQSFAEHARQAAGTPEEQAVSATVPHRPTDDETWLVLRHHAGPSAPDRGPIFAHPDFAEHAAFLGRLADAGVLVAAGPLAVGDQPGAHGMTVIRVPTAEVPGYLQRARTEDGSVVRGLLEVEPVTWNVVMSG